MKKMLKLYLCGMLLCVTDVLFRPLSCVAYSIGGTSAKEIGSVAMKKNSI